MQSYITQLRKQVPLLADVCAYVHFTYHLGILIAADIYEAPI